MSAAPPTAKVLIVDDDQSLRETLGEWLQLEGYDVRLAADGLDALELVRWEPFDVVVTDLRMPNLDGLGLLDRLESLTPDVRVIFLSGEATITDAIEALRGGRSFDFLQKPLAGFDRLSRSIARTLELRPLAPRAPEAAVAVEPNGHPVIERVFAYLRERLSDSIGLKEVADAMGYSPSYLTALVRETTGQPVMQWVTSLRLDESRRLLEETEQSVAQVAAAVGIPDAKYFSRLFRRAYGQSPQTWREREGA